MYFTKRKVDVFINCGHLSSSLLANINKDIFKDY